MPINDSNQIVVIVSVTVDFVKSTMFKGKIISNSIEEYKYNCNCWLKEVKARGLHLPPGYNPQSIFLFRKNEKTQ